MTRIAWVASPRGRSSESQLWSIATALFPISWLYLAPRAGSRPFGAAQPASHALPPRGRHRAPCGTHEVA